MCEGEGGRGIQRERKSNRHADSAHPKDRRSTQNLWMLAFLLKPQLTWSLREKQVCLGLIPLCRSASLQTSACDRYFSQRSGLPPYFGRCSEIGVPVAACGAEDEKE